jgi:L-fuconolactonase
MNRTASAVLVEMTSPSPRDAFEPVIEPDLPIIDSHHHVWYLPETTIPGLATQTSVAAQALLRTFRRHPRYLLDELRADVESGHNVRATVFVNARTMYRSSGPEAMKPVGEVEFVNGLAAMAESGVFGTVKYCAGIVGTADLMLGDAVEDVLRQQIRAGGSRYCGIRATGIAHDNDASILGPGGVAHRMREPKFRAGFKWLHALGLSFDAFLVEPQLPELIDLARSFPETSIILNHCGAPLGVGLYSGKRAERFPLWRENMRTLAKCENVVVKLGGLGTPFGGFKSYGAVRSATSLQLAEEWRPYIETCIETFGAGRCMFESNYPVDAAVCSYPVLWNAFKRLAAGATTAEKSALFSETAARVYRIERQAS